MSIRDTRRNAGPRLPTQNLSFSVYGPNNKDNPIQATYRHTQDDAYVQSLPNGEIIAFKIRTKGDLHGQGESLPMWGHTFSMPMSVVSVYHRDLLNNLNSELRYLMFFAKRAPTLVTTPLSFYSLAPFSRMFFRMSHQILNFPTVRLLMLEWYRKQGACLP